MIMVRSHSGQQANHLDMQQDEYDHLFQEMQILLAQSESTLSHGIWTLYFNVQE